MGMTLPLSELVLMVAALVGAGAVAGVIGGLFGVGGGTVLVPALFYAFSVLGVGGEGNLHVAIGTSLLTFLAATAKSMKEAQSHIVWLMLLPMVPSFVLMMNPIKTELWQFAVPFLAQNQLLLKVIRAEPITMEVWALYLAASLALAGLLWFAAVRRYQQEKLAVAG